ncbi:MAG: hypothetical protein DIU78_021930 [Pseudomonadota bacterium]
MGSRFEPSRRGHARRALAPRARASSPRAAGTRVEPPGRALLDATSLEGQDERVAPATVLDDPSFQRAFVAISYFAGQRGDALLAPLERPGPAVLELAAALASTSRGDRARALSTELELLKSALTRRRLA